MSFEKHDKLTAEEITKKVEGKMKEAEKVKDDKTKPVKKEVKGKKETKPKATKKTTPKKETKPKIAKKTTPKKETKPKATKKKTEKEKGPVKPTRYELIIEPRLADIRKWKYEGKTNVQVAQLLSLTKKQFEYELERSEKLRDWVNKSKKSLEYELEYSYLEVLKRGYHIDEELLVTPDGSKVLQRKIKKRAISSNDVEFGLKLLNYQKWVKGEIDNDNKQALPTFGGGDDDL